MSRLRRISADKFGRMFQSVTKFELRVRPRQFMNRLRIVTYGTLPSQGRCIQAQTIGDIREISGEYWGETCRTRLNQLCPFLALACTQVSRQK